MWRRLLVEQVEEFGRLFRANQDKRASTPRSTIMRA
jgi:hypothetical protein